MAIRMLFKSPTINAGVWWETVYSHQGWCVQYNSSLDTITPLKPYRLLDPEGYLLASADTLSDFEEHIDRLIDHYNQCQPIITREEAARRIFDIVMVIVTHVGKRAAEGKLGQHQDSTVNPPRKGS